MFKILKKEKLNSNVTLMDIYAPRIAKKAQPGQFIIFIIDEGGERIPLTIADYNAEVGSITIIFQEVGKTTKQLATLNAGDSIKDFVGPLGKPSHFDGVKKACVIGGGLGAAIAYPQAKMLHSIGAEVHSIVGFRNSDLVILEEQMSNVSDELYIVTEDGSKGTKGFVTNALKKLLDEGNKYDVVVAIGPLIMMKAVSEMTREYKVKTIVSMNPIMIDGTGMCGGCRLTVDGETKFACVDGPDFDGHLVNFDEAMKRQTMYKKKEIVACEDFECKLGGKQNA
jgi:ferredoxin--NADP+ reductase